MNYVTIIDIAKALGISKSTVSRALSGDSANVKPETVQLVLETARRMGYHRNELAINLRKKSSRTIGIVIPEAVAPFFMTFVDEAQKRFNKDGYRVMVAISNEDAVQERANLEMFEQCRVDGIVISVCHDSVNKDLYERIISHGTPIVFFDRKVEGINASQVVADDYTMSFFLVEHLIRMGRSRIVHLAGPKHVRNSVARRMGYRDALAKFRIGYDADYVVDGGLNDEEGCQAIRRFAEKGLAFDAVFAFTETSALGAKSALQKMGFSIPGDVALACMSGTVLSTLVHPAITAVEQPVTSMAEHVCRLILEQIHNPSATVESVVLRGETIFRESTPQFKSGL
ncbi:MAG: LacI family DNA-binding transcriptional regulator [Alloprevotella sp.]